MNLSLVQSVSVSLHIRLPPVYMYVCICARMNVYSCSSVVRALLTCGRLCAASILGLSQAGLAETIQFVLGKYPAAAQQRLAGNVFVTGGVANIPGLRARLERELREMRPFQSRWGALRSAGVGFMGEPSSALSGDWFITESSSVEEVTN